MRWSCPHCGTHLAVSDDKLGSGWSFSRCYKCGGFALVRRAEINLVKVDRAPAGENILLPEASEEPNNNLMNMEATENLARLRKESAEKAALRQAARVVQQQQHIAMAQAIQNGQVSTQAQAQTPPQGVPRVANAAPPPVMTKGASTGKAPEFPPPLPELPEVRPEYRAKARVLPVAIGVAAASAVGSGVFLFDQGHQLWEKAKQPATAYTMPARHAIQTTAATITDQVHQQAMAPVRSSNPTVEAPRPAHSAPSMPALTEEAKTQLHETKPANHAQAAQDKSLVVRLKNDYGMLRSGPGTHFPVVGKAGPGQQYRVIDWNDRWFRVMVQESTGKSAFAAWIRNDLVQVVSR